MATNRDSRFSRFRISPLEGVTITGIHYLPSPSSTAPKDRPLIVLLHGATCSAHNFDVSPSLTASLMADALSIPLVSINRPGYADSTPLCVPEDSTFHQTLAKFYHDNLFPVLWARFGEPAGCTALVPFAHSFGSPGMILAAGIHAQDVEPKYPLAGIIFSGWGNIRAIEQMAHPTDPSQKLTWKRMIMLGKPENDCAPAEAVNALAIQDQPAAPGERDDVINGAWFKYWRSYSDHITVPVMYGQAEFDFFWEGSMRQVAEMVKCFPKCRRFDGSFVAGAPHAIEWSWMAQGWYARCFGFAAEVVSLYAMESA